jgi:signal transduction histidine kinase/FixJ family two-component response regulator/HPt (histidine-containing phosphotransfer) domain-containing protein
MMNKSFLSVFSLWKKAIKRNIGKTIFIFALFSVMIFVVYGFTSRMLWRHMLIEAEEIVSVAEAKIENDFLEAEVALTSCYRTVQEMIKEEASHKEIEQYVSRITASLRENLNGNTMPYYGIYGYVKGKFLDGVSYYPDSTYEPKERAWFKTAAQADTERAVFTNPYSEWRDKEMRVSLVRNLGTGNQDEPDVLAMDINFSHITKLQDLAMTIGSYFILLDRDLKIIMHPTEVFIGQDIATINKDYAEIAVSLSQKQDVIAKKVSLETEAGVSWKIVFFKQIFNGWYLGLSFPYQEFYLDINYLLITLFFLGLVFVGFIIIIITSFDVARMKANEENQLKTSFISQLNHEIRTPMNAIIGMCDLALEMNSLPLVKLSIKDIKRAGFNLLSIINANIDISKIEAGILELRKEPYSLSMVLNDVENTIRKQVNEKKLIFKTQIDNSIPPMLIGDEVRLREILLNLLTNAVKYTHEGSISFIVSVKSKASDTVTLCFEIADTGIGIKKEDIPKIFGDHVRLDREKNKLVEGFGLGLFITSQLIKAMKGMIIVSSEYGKGSHFIVIIHQTISDELIDQEKPCPILDNSRRFIAPSARILAVDDNPTNLKVIEGLLSLYHIQVSTCIDGQSAIFLSQQYNHDIIFMDHRMPGMDGIETARKIRRLGGVFEEIPIIALTADADIGAKETFLANGFNDYLLKPVELSALNAILVQWIDPSKQIEKPDQSEPKAVERIQISGIDTEMGISCANGSPSAYQEVLRVFLRDTERRLASLREPSVLENLREFSINVHALKSGSASIGAGEIAEQAALLEKAASDGNRAFIREQLSGFCLKIAETLENIRLFLEQAGQEVITGDQTGEIWEELVRLQNAIKMENLQTIDNSMQKLASAPLDQKTRKVLETVSDHLLVSEFREACAALKDSLSIEEIEKIEKIEEHEDY